MRFRTARAVLRNRMELKQKHVREANERDNAKAKPRHCRTNKSKHQAETLPNITQRI